MVRKDISGKIFGKLTVINHCGYDLSLRNSMYLCRCDCGNEKIINRCSIVNGDSKSCGCLKRPPAQKKIKENILIDENGCWNWKGKIHPSGYVDLYGSKAHRVSYEAFVDKIPDGKLVLHKCDNRKCVNPEHLYIGTHKDNVRDMIDRKRQRFHQGEDHQNSIFTNDQIRKIREDYVKVKNYREVARIHGIKPNRAQRIIKRLVYKCVS